MMTDTGVTVSKRLVAVNSLSSLLSKVISATVLIWLYQYLVKRVDATEYSLLPLVASLMVFAPLVTKVITGGIGRFVLAAHAQRDHDRVQQIVSSMFPLLLAVSLFFMAIGSYFAWNASQFLNIPPDRIWEVRAMLMMALFSFAVRLPCAPFGVGLYVHQRFIQLNIIELATQLLRALFLLILLKWIGPRVVLVILANSGAELIGLVTGQICSRRLMPTLRFSRSSVDRSVAKQLLSFSGWNFLAQLGSTIRESADILVLNKLATPVDVASFQLGSLPDGQLRQGMVAITGPIEPALTALHATSAHDRIRRAYLDVGRYSLFAVMAIMLPLFIYRTEIYHLYLGARYSTYAAAVPVMALLLLGCPLRYSGAMVFKLAQASGRVRGLALIVFFTQIANLAVSIYFVGVMHLGAVGSALGTTIIECVTWPAGFLPLGWKFAGVSVGRWFRETLVSGLVPSLAGGSVWYGLKMALRPDSWAGLAVVGVSGLICYFGALVVFSLTPQERAQLKNRYNRGTSYLRSFRSSTPSAP